MFGLLKQPSRCSPNLRKNRFYEATTELVNASRGNEFAMVTIRPFRDYRLSDKMSTISQNWPALNRISGLIEPAGVGNPAAIGKRYDRRCFRFRKIGELTGRSAFIRI